MTAGQPGSRLVQRETSWPAERGGNPIGNIEVRLQVFRQWTLGRLDEPRGVAKKHGRALRSVQSIEAPLEVVEPIRCVLNTLIPDSETETFEQTKHEHGIEGFGIPKPPASAGPSMMSPVLVRAENQLQRIELVDEGVFRRDRLEAIGQMFRGQLSLQP